ncbi:MAG: pantetheine-phosphate adenylyltransferase [Desulfococcus multivorans]|jgi:pantetheine-phosphate adenylyltransferase|nr:pantetheine-phosphate adenylyltransferase [Desulfococcus multivorans]
MIRALFPGSFDPATNGHLNLIRRAAEIWDEIDVVIAVNPLKKYTFSAEERFSMMQSLVRDYDNVKVTVWDKLIVDYAEKVGAKIIIRGVRALADFTYEFELSMINKGLNPGVETIFMPTDPQYFVLRSSAIKEIAMFGGDVSSMVPPVVAEALGRKLSRP